MKAFYEVITAAVRDFEKNGYDSEERLRFWMEKIRVAAEASMVSDAVLQRALKDNLSGVFRRLVEAEGLLKTHRGIDRFTLNRVKPQLRAELDRRIMASANLIKLNRQEAIQKTLQRFSGWSTSIPAGGSKVVDTVDTKDHIKKSLKQLPFEERRVIIDQSHKFIASLNETLAVSGGAIAGIWHSHWRQPGYNYRKDHRERDQLVYALRGNWAIEKGLMKKGPAGYYDEVTAVAQEPFCRCNLVYIYNLRGLPEDMLTEKGRESLAAVRMKIKEMQSA